MRKTWQVPFTIASLFRLVYGLGSMLDPEWMAAWRLAPSLRDHPDPRMNLRGFGGAQTGIALFTLARLRRTDRARDLLGLNALVDAFDAGVSALEIRDRGRLDYMATAGVVVNVVMLSLWAAAAARLPPRAARPRATVPA